MRINISHKKQNINYKGCYSQTPELHLIKNAVKKTIPYFDSPSWYYRTNQANNININELNQNIKTLRSHLSNIYQKGNFAEYICELISLVRGLKIANCSEISEIVITALKINGFKNYNIVGINIGNIYNKNKFMPLDHNLVALDVPITKDEQNEIHPFLPKPNTKIIDLWMDGFIGTYKDAINKYTELFNINSKQRIFFKPIKHIELNDTDTNLIKTKYPTLVIDKTI